MEAGNGLGADRPTEPAAPPPKAAAAERSRSPAAEEESVELDVDIISPTAVVDFKRSSVEVYDLNTGRSVRILQTGRAHVQPTRVPQLQLLLTTCPRILVLSQYFWTQSALSSALGATAVSYR